jgi:anti-sigma-K factor RskA
MGAGTVAEPRRATKSKAVTIGGVAANIFRWFVRLGAVGKRILRIAPRASVRSPNALALIQAQCSVSAALSAPRPPFATPAAIGATACGYGPRPREQPLVVVVTDAGHEKLVSMVDPRAGTIAGSNLRK